MHAAAARRLAAGLVILSGLSIAGVATADPADHDGCAAGDDLMSVERINATITTPGFEQALIDFDAAGNADGYLCVHVLPDAAAKTTPFDPLFLASDNTRGNPNSVVVNDPRVRPAGP
jgi:hypothetical protein